MGDLFGRLPHMLREYVVIVRFTVQFQRRLFLYGGGISVLGGGLFRRRGMMRVFSIKDKPSTIRRRCLFSTARILAQALKVARNKITI